MSRTGWLGLLAIALATSTSGTPASAPALTPKAFTWEEILARPLGTSGLSRQVLRDPTATLDQLEFHIQASNHLHGIKNVGDTPASYYVINWHSPGMLKQPQAQ